MSKITRDNRSYRGMLQSEDGVITRVLAQKSNQITFESRFGLSTHMIERLAAQPEHIVFSERSRIARLGIQITSELPTIDHLVGDELGLTQTATAVIPGYPQLNQLAAFIDQGLPVGRMVFCDPQALLSSEEVMAAIERAELKLPASTAISSDGSIVITPHKTVCTLRNDIDDATFGRILLQADGREMLNRYQINRSVPNLIIPPGEGVITTCSMYLNEHYVVLQSGFALGRNLPATVLDPIKTRGIRIYLEIINGTSHTIVNPLISARIYGAPKFKTSDRRKPQRRKNRYDYKAMKTLEARMAAQERSTCHFLDQPAAVIKPAYGGIEKAQIAMNGPQNRCRVSEANCAVARHEAAVNSDCPHIYATSRLEPLVKKTPVVLALKYFPNLIEHRDIVNLAAGGRISALYFFAPSCEHGPFLSQEDHSRLQEYHAYDIAVYWVCGLNRRLMVHTMRDGKGYFVATERLAEFHKSMLFAFYGSTLPLSRQGRARLGALMDERQ